MKKRIISVALALCLFASAQSMASAEQDESSLQEDVRKEVQEDVSGNDQEEEIFTEETESEPTAHDSTIPTPTEVYEAMIQLREDDRYKEGTTWTNYEPYSDSKGNYKWNGGPLGGANIEAAGCAAFAFILSDAAFGSLPARMYASGGFSYEDIKAGDILRVNNDSHTVIVLEVSEAGVVIAEGNYNSTVHWGRAIPKDLVMRDTSHYITRYPEGYVSPDDPAANEVIESGTLEGGLVWKLTGAGVLTISGSGSMPDFGSNEDQPWYSASGQIRKIVIEEGVTTIGAGAFWGCGVLGAEIGSSVTAIGDSAFYKSSIISAAIPSGVKTIGGSAFRNCSNLGSVTFPEGLEKIGENAFRGCQSLTTAALPASVEEVGSGAFMECTEMTTATFAPGNKTVTLGDNIFTRCYKLGSVTLPQSIDKIGEGMFQNCLTLAKVEIPQGAESIGGSAFASSGVQAVIIPDSVTTIGTAAFSACSYLTDIYYTGTEAQWNSVSKIGDTASAVSAITVHYNYVAPTPTPMPTPTPNPAETEAPDSSATPAPTQSPNPAETQKPAEEPDVTAAPGSGEGATPAPDATATPGSGEGATPAPDATATPGSGEGATPAPDATATPGSGEGATPAPDGDTTPSGDGAAPAPAPSATPAPVSGGGSSHSGSGVVYGSTAFEGIVVAEDGMYENVPAGNMAAAAVSIAEAAAAAAESGTGGIHQNLDVIAGRSFEVSAAVLNNLAGVNVTLALHVGDGIALSITGTDVQNTDVPFNEKLVPSTIPAEVKNAVAADAPGSYEFSFEEQGEFPFHINVHINFGEENVGRLAILYRYDEATGALAAAGMFRVNGDGQAMFGLEQGGQYVAVVADRLTAYTVVSGDTFSRIATRHGMTTAALKAVNPDVANINKIRVGQVLNVY